MGRKKDQKKMERKDMAPITGRCYDIDHLVYIREDRPALEEDGTPKLDEDGNVQIISVPVAFRPLTEDEEVEVKTKLREVIYSISMSQYLLNSEEDYEAFVEQMTDIYYNRLTKKSIDFSGNGKKGNTPVQSIKNTLDSGLFWKAKTFAKKKKTNTFTISSSDDVLRSAIKDYTSSELEADIINDEEERYEEIFNEIDKYINEMLKNSIFNKDLLTRENIEMSVKLSLLNVLTLENQKTADLKRQMNLILKQCRNIDKYIILWRDDSKISEENVLFYIRKLFMRLSEEFNEVQRDSERRENNIESIFDPGFFGGSSSYDYEE